MAQEIPLAPYDGYRRWLVELSPPWLQGPRGAAVLSSLGAALDEVVSWTLTGVLARFIQRAPEDALALLGSERGLDRFPGEHLEAYRSSLFEAWEFWRWGGTLRGLQYRLNAAGYDALIYEHYREDRAAWAEFSVYLWPRIASYVTDSWDDGALWDDGTIWNHSLASSELARIPALINQVKPAHAKVRRIYYIPGPRDAWDDGGTWDDGGAWNPEPIPIV